MSPLTQASNVTEVQLVEPSVCAAACREIYAQRARWCQRRLFEEPPFYTLGAASYLDLGFSAGRIDDYLANAGSLWSWARDAVLTIADRLRHVLEAHLGKPVEYPSTLPPPGFHIFIGASIPRTDCSPAMRRTRVADSPSGSR